MSIKSSGWLFASLLLSSQIFSGLWFAALTFTDTQSASRKQYNWQSRTSGTWIVRITWLAKAFPNIGRSKSNWRQLSVTRDRIKTTFCKCFENFMLKKFRFIYLFFFFWRFRWISGILETFPWLQKENFLSYFQEKALRSIFPWWK